MSKPLFINIPIKYNMSLRPIRGGLGKYQDGTGRGGRGGGRGSGRGRGRGRGGRAFPARTIILDQDFIQSQNPPIKPIPLASRPISLTSSRLSLADCIALDENFFHVQQKVPIAYPAEQSHVSKKNFVSQSELIYRQDHTIMGPPRPRRGRQRRSLTRRSGRGRGGYHNRMSSARYSVDGDLLDLNKEFIQTSQSLTRESRKSSRFSLEGGTAINLDNLIDAPPPPPAPAPTPPTITPTTTAAALDNSCLKKALPGRRGYSFQWPNGTKLEVFSRNGTIKFHSLDGSTFTIDTKKRPAPHSQGTITQKTVNGHKFDIVATNYGLFRSSRIREVRQTSSSARPFKHQNLLTEDLLQTQEKHVHSLEILKKHFVAPLDKFCKRKKIDLLLSDLQLDKIHELNVRWLIAVRAAAEDLKTMEKLDKDKEEKAIVVALLIHFLDEIMDDYSQYLNKCDGVIQHMKGFFARYPQLHDYVEHQEQSLGHEIQLLELLQFPRMQAISLSTLIQKATQRKGWTEKQKNDLNRVKTAFFQMSG